MWACCRDIDPGALAKVPKERAFFNVAKTNGPRYRSTHTSATPGLGETRDRSCKLKKHASQKPDYFLRFFFCKLLLPPLFPSGTSIAAARSRARFGLRCPLPELLYAGVRGQRTFVTAAPSLLELSTAGMSEIWRRVFAIRINEIVISIRSYYN